MRFSLNHSDNNYPDLLIVPISKQDDQSQLFSNISTLTNVPAGVLKTDFSSDFKQIQTLYYQEDLRLKEIGVVLGLSESRVSRLLSQAHGTLKNIITRFENN